MRGTRTFEVYKSTQFVGFIKASSHPAAVRRATEPLRHLRRRASRPLQERGPRLSQRQHLPAGEAIAPLSSRRL
jgi:hypothetical protein